MPQTCWPIARRRKIAARSIATTAINQRTRESSTVSENDFLNCIDPQGKEITNMICQIVAIAKKSLGLTAFIFAIHVIQPGPDARSQRPMSS